MRYIIVILILILFTASTTLAETDSLIYVLNNSDAANMSQGFQYALEKSANHQATDWQNPLTGLSGSIVPTKTYQTSYGQYCREYLATVQFQGAMQQAFGTACRQASGSWKIAGEKLVKRPDQALKFVYLKQAQQRNCGCVFKSQQVRRMKMQRFHGEQFHQNIRQMNRGKALENMPRQQNQQQPSMFVKLVEN